MKNNPGHPVFWFKFWPLLLFVALTSWLMGGCQSAPATTSVTSAPAVTVPASERERFAKVFQETASAQPSEGASPLDLSKTQVLATGTEKTVLLYENPDFTPELARLTAKMMFEGKPEILAKTQEFQFSEVVFTNGITSWKMNVQKGDWWSVGNP